MKITEPQIGLVTPPQLHKVGKSTASSSVNGTQSFDQLLLSADTNAIDAARKSIAQSPEVREDKVEAFRQQIQNGTYNVPAEKIADRMLTESRLAKLNNK